jgi:hypothetical protein
MKNNIKTIFVVLLGLAISTSGCDYSTENIDPANQNNVPIQFILSTALSQSGYNQTSGTARLSGIITQHFSGFDAQQIDFEKYLISETTLNNYWNFGLYSGVMKDCSNMITKGEAEELPHNVGIAKILMANAFGSGTSIFGDMPYSEALQGVSIDKPKYDTQESVYAAVQTLLDEAIVALGQTQAAPVDFDLIHDGNVTRWIETAHALKARYYMHTSKRVPANVALALAQVNLAFTSSADQPDFNFSTALAFANPLALFGNGRPKTLIFNTNFYNNLVANSDPRSSIYAAADGTEWLYYTDGTASGPFWGANDAPAPLISYSELMFIKAEAEIIGGGSGDVSVRAAISANMDYLGVATAARDAYLAAITIPSTVQSVIEEAYVGLYGQAEVEVWTNYRRTGFPSLTPHPLGVNALNPSGVIPERIPYAQNERITNSANLDAAIANQGPDLVDTKLWAFK